MARLIDRRGFFTMLGGSASAALLAGCAGEQAESPAEDVAVTDEAPAQTTGIDYMVLVNKQNELPDNWEDEVEIVSFKNTEDWDVDVEKKAYDAYLELKKELEGDKVYVDLDSAYRSVAAQQEIWDDFTEKYGEEYTKLHVAVPGFSEHHTGLALDLFLIIDGKGVYLNEDMVTHPKLWKKIHARLADHGFILRYLPQRKIMTGYSYEPWHIRYIDDPAIAHEITDAGLTFEEYLDKVDPAVAGCEVDYGTSEVYVETDIDSALDVILAQFKTWDGCVMKHIAYAGDEACGAEELDYVNSLREADGVIKEPFDQALVLVTTFHSPSAEQVEGTAWEADTDYEGYTWHMGRTGADGAWKLMTWGYG